VLNLRSFIEEVRWKNNDVPIYIYGETKTSQHLPNDILRELHGFIHTFEDTPEFVARHIVRDAKSYLEGIQPPFFKAQLNYAEDGSYSWHCPGHYGLHEAHTQPPWDHRVNPEGRVRGDQRKNTCRPAVGACPTHRWLR
jgi:hypothetical protein